MENKLRIKNCIKTNSGTDVIKHWILAFFHSWCEPKICFLSPPMAYDLQLLRAMSMLQQCDTICSSGLCVCVCVCIHIHTYIHSTGPMRFIFQVRCSVYVFTPPNTTFGRKIFTQRPYKFNSHFLSGPGNWTAVQHSIIRAIDGQ